jgi:hypothetical protein
LTTPMMKLCVLVPILLLTFGCSRSGLVERRIGERVNACKPTITCVVRITDVTDFQWDQMHVFEYTASRDTIEKSLGTQFPNYTEFTRRIIFLRSGRIVHREDEPTDFERLVNGQVSFAESYTEPHWSYTPETAVFRAQKQQFEGGAYFTLTQVK